MNLSCFAQCSAPFWYSFLSLFIISTGEDVTGPMLIAKLSKRCASAMLFNRTKSNGNDSQFLIRLIVGMTWVRACFKLSSSQTLNLAECRAQYGERSPPPSAASFWVCQCKYFGQVNNGTYPNSFFLLTKFFLQHSFFFLLQITFFFQISFDKP